MSIDVVTAFDNTFSQPIAVQIPLSDKDKDFAISYLVLEAYTSSEQTIRRAPDWTWKDQQILKDAQVHVRAEFAMLSELLNSAMSKGWGDHIDITLVGPENRCGHAR